MDGNLNKDLDENLPWLTQQTEDPKSDEGNLIFPTHTLNVIELNCKIIKKVATPHFYINPPISSLSPLSWKKFRTTQFLEGPTPPPLIRGGGQLCSCSVRDILSWMTPLILAISQ